MRQIRMFLLVLMLMVCPNIVLASEAVINPEGLVTPIENLFNVNLGMQLDVAKGIIAKNSKWVDKNIGYKYGVIYTYRDDITGKAIMQVKRELSLNADQTSTINAITYILYFQDEAAYNKLVNKLVAEANSEFGAMQDEQIIGGERESLHRTWGRDNLHITIATRYYPEYSPKYPYIVSIMRTKS